MPSTKIINVLRTDKFDDIINVFKETAARDVIFVLPKNSKALNRKEHFVQLASQSKELDKTVSILSTSPEINKLAADHKFIVLSVTKKGASTGRPTAKLAAARFDPPEFDNENDDDLNPSDYKNPKRKKDDDDARDVPEGFHEEDEDVSKKEEDDDEKEIEEGLGEDVGEEVGEELADDDEALAEDTSSKGILSPVATFVSTLGKNRIVQDIIHPSRAREEASVDIDDDSDNAEKIEIKKSKISHAADHSDSSTLDKIREVWMSGGWDSPSEERPKSKKPLFAERNMGRSTARSGFKLGDSQNFSKKLAVTLGAAAVVVLAAVLYISMGSAEVIIKPKDHAVNLSLKVRVSDKFSSVDFDENRIPGQLFDISKTVESNYPATGEREVAQKARGKITVFNEYSSQPQTLIATTRFQAENGLIFRALSTVTVPGLSGATPGRVEVEVIADKAGDTYNIGGTKFYIPAFKEKGDTARYEKFYATSSEPMRGGIVGRSKVVTENDYASGKADIEVKAVAAAKSEIDQQSSGLKTVSPTSPQLKSFQSSAKVDEAVENINMSATAAVKLIAFKESDIHEFINQYLQKTGNLVSFPEKLELSYQSAVMTDAGILEFNLVVNGTSYSIVDKNKISEDLVGKKEEEIKSYMATKPEIKSTRVILNPFWVTKIPKDPTKVTISFDYQ